MEPQGYDIKEVVAQSHRTILRRAVRRRDQARVILKMPLREQPNRRESGQLEFEYRILRKLKSPGVIRAEAFEKEAAQVAMVLEDFGGENLPALGAGGLPLKVFFEIALSVARALGEIHSQNVIHKDIKPRNILMNPLTRAVKLIDFNIACEVSTEHQEIATQLEGSLPYLSPEQTGRMSCDVDYRTDYYSLGVTLYELATGVLPFVASDAMGWVECHISQEPPDARQARPDLPAALAGVIRKLMAKSPDDRYQSARGLLKDLEGCQRQCAELEAGQPMSSFVIGGHDLSERFQVSRKLFGREDEAANLLELFESASNGPARLLLVAGYSGVGKSSLIHGIHKAIVSRRGNFIAGKFDQLDRNAPYGVLVQMLRGLVQQLLTDPDERLLDWRRTLGPALGAQGRVLLDLIPELEQVVGPQPPVAELSPREAQERFQPLFRELIKAIARPEHPLVIFLDDLQWTDASTPDLLVSLLADEELRHVLFIGAYRDNEVTPTHLLQVAVAELARRRPGAVQTIELRPLSELSVSQIVADTLRCEPADSRALAAMVSRKTHGNPFFVNELLGMLYREGAFPFLSAEGRWGWDAAKVESLQVSDDVVDLMVQRIGRLSPRAIEYLRHAACLGSRFDLSTLTRTVDMPAGTIASALREAVQERILFPIGGAYRLVQEHLIYDDDELEKLGVEYQFQHDRVWQAAYSMLTDWERSRIHLTIGRLTRSAEPPTAERAALFFERLNHLNLGRSLITSAKDRAELAELNFVAGQRAMRSAAYAIAASYLEKSMDLLSAEEAAADPRRRFECRRGRAECLFLAGELERASDLCDELHAHAHDKVSQGAVFYLQAGILEHQGLLREAVGTIRTGLARLGVELPSEEGELQRRVGEGIATMQAHLARTPIEDFVNLPEMTNQEKIMIMNLLFQLVPSAIQTNPPLFVLAEVIMFDLALTHGVSAASCKNFVDCGIIQGGMLGDYEGAYRLGKVAFRLLERYLPTPLESSVHFVFAAFVSHWRSHYEESFASFARALRAGLEMGDVRHVCYTRVFRAQRMFLVGRNLDECHAETESTARHLTEARAVGPLNGLDVLRRALAPLRGTTAEPDGAQMSDERFAEMLRTTGNPHAIFTHGQMQAMVNFLLGDLAAAAKWDAYAAPSVAAAAGSFSLPDYHLFQGLILAQQVKDAGQAERPALLERIGAIVDRLGKWAGHSPGNFAHKLALAQAELARVRGAPLEEVIPLYDEALRAAGDGFLNIRALVHELEAQFLAERGQLDLARTHLEEAYDLYRSWGAQAKLRQLERRHPDWLSARVPSDEAAGSRR
ncbi:MAG TPA: serine/threonine-protein kinase PknK [Polyangia bacterium]|nr:serine/threonine-protein kinase PknK [Polyangia bacterium]